MRAELTGLNGRVLFLRECDKTIEQSPTYIRWRGRREPGPQAMPRVGRQRELRHQQQFAANLLQTEVHFAAFVVENPVFQNSGEQLPAALWRIGRLNTDQDQQACADLADDLIVDANCSGGDALQEANHGKMRGLFPPTGLFDPDNERTIPLVKVYSADGELLPIMSIKNES